jgi:hypothetical protein
MLIPAVLALIVAAGVAWWLWPGRHTEPRPVQVEVDERSGSAVFGTAIVNYRAALRQSQQ